MEITRRRDVNHTYVMFQEGEIQVEAYGVQMALHNLVEGLLPCSLYTLDNSQIWCCETTSRQPLSVYCQAHPLGLEELIWIFGGILDNLKNMQSYLMEAGQLYLMPEELYLNPWEHRVYCCVVPFYDQDIWKSLLNLIQYLLGYLNQEEAEAVSLAYGIFRYLGQGGSSIEELWTLVYGNTGFNGQKKEHKKIHEITGEKEERKSLERNIDTESSEKRKKQLDDFFLKDIQEPEHRKVWDRVHEKLAQADKFPKWILWLLPGVTAVFGACFLFFNFWHLTLIVKIMVGGASAAACLMTVICWYRFGREQEEEEPDFLHGKKQREENPDFFQEERRLEDTPDFSYGKKQCGDEMDAARQQAEPATMLLAGFSSGTQAALKCERDGSSFHLGHTPVLIGKMRDSVQLLLDEPVVSRIHARIIWNLEGYYLEDLNSKNGTFLNGELLDGQSAVLLSDGDIISFADQKYCFSENSFK